MRLRGVLERGIGEDKRAILGCWASNIQAARRPAEPGSLFFLERVSLSSRGVQMTSSDIHQQGVECLRLFSTKIKHLFEDDITTSIC